MSRERLKEAAARRALDFVRPGQRLGLGTGSTAAHFVRLLGARVAAGLDVVCVPTSEETARQAAALGIPLADLDDLAELDLTVDGADELDGRLRLIKGGGGALLREKIVAAASRRMIVIADAGKQVGRLGRFPLPVEVVPFGLGVTTRQVEAACGAPGRVTLRRNGDASFLTDGDHLILDCAIGAIVAPEALAAALDAIPGVVGHGLFIGLCTTALVAGDDGVAVIGEGA